MDKEAKREYWRLLRRQEREIKAMGIRLGRAVFAARKPEKPDEVDYREPNLASAIREETAELLAWHRAYETWRAEQGQPMRSVEYRELPKAATPAIAAVRAAKETAYRLRKGQRKMARAALRDFLRAGEMMAVEEMQAERAKKKPPLRS